LDEEGSMCMTQRSIEKAFANYYHHLFTSASPQGIEYCTNAIGGKVPLELCTHLVIDFAEELHNAMFQMAPDKVSGPDEFFDGFY
jgi:hypothetical protein